MKTIINKIILLFCFVTVTLSLTSCLKDDPMFDWGRAIPVIELPYKSHDITKTKVKNTVNESVELMVNYTVPSASDNTEDIGVTLAVDASMVTQFNNGLAASAQKYVLLPAGTYTLPTVVIRKGTQLWKETMTVNTATLQAGMKYLLPIKITGAPAGYTISGNFGYVYLRIDMQ